MIIFAYDLSILFYKSTGKNPCGIYDEYKTYKLEFNI